VSFAQITCYTTLDNMSKIAHFKVVLTFDGKFLKPRGQKFKPQLKFALLFPLSFDDN